MYISLSLTLDTSVPSVTIVRSVQIRPRDAWHHRVIVFPMGPREMSGRRYRAITFSVGIEV